MTSVVVFFPSSFAPTVGSMTSTKLYTQIFSLLFSAAFFSYSTLSATSFVNLMPSEADVKYLLCVLISKEVEKVLVLAQFAEQRINWELSRVIVKV